MENLLEFEKNHEKLTIAVFKNHEKLMKKKCFRNWYEPCEWILLCGY